MPAGSTPRGTMSIPETPLPYIADFRNSLILALGAAHASVAAAEAAGATIDMRKSRYGVDNEIHLLVKGAVGTKVTIYVKEDADYFYVAEATLTQANQHVRFVDLLCGLYILQVTAGAYPVTIHGGGTK